MDFNQKFEPKGNKVIHGAGQSPEQFKKYWEAVENYKPLIYMAYNRLNEVREKLLRKLEELQVIDGNLWLQLGLNLKPKGEKEKCKEITEGKYDEEILFLVKSLGEFKNPVFLRLGYECNDPTHSYNSKYFIMAWRYIANIFRKNNISNVAFVWSVCTAFSRDITELMKYYPGDEYVDWFADDLFGVRHFTEKNNPKIITEAFCNEAEKHKKPLMIGESSPAKIGVDKGEESWNMWFKPYFEWIKEHPVIKAFCYINWNWGVDWNQPEWGNCRIEENDYVRKRFVKELSKECYINHEETKKNKQKLNKEIYEDQEEVHDKIYDFIRSTLPKEVTEAYLWGSVVERKFGKYDKKFGFHDGSDIDVIIMIPKEKIPSSWKYLNTEKEWWSLYRGGSIGINGTIHLVDLLVVKEGKEEDTRNRIKEKNWKVERIK